MKSNKIHRHKVAPKKKDVCKVRCYIDLIKRKDGDFSIVGTLSLKVGTDKLQTKKVSVHNIKKTNFQFDDYIEQTFTRMMKKSPSYKNFGG